MLRLEIFDVLLYCTVLGTKVHYKRRYAVGPVAEDRQTGRGKSRKQTLSRVAAEAIGQKPAVQ